MTTDQLRDELEVRLARYKALASEFSEGPTHQNIRREIDIIQRQLRELDERNLRPPG